jgi:acetoin utilization deacetylase AcuC-like enzyme
VVVPALRAFRPELIIVASGFDASAYDPLGRMDLNAGDFRALTAILMHVAADVCDGRLLMSHEGGYSSFYVPYCGLAVIEQMSGHRSDTDFSGVAPDGHRAGPRPLEAHERAAVERAAANVELVPKA